MSYHIGHIGKLWRLIVKKLLALILLSCQLACSSLTDQGDDLFEKGLYLEAEKTYNEALQKDANDSKAMSGLQKARVKIIDVGLIEVRMLRLAKNFLVAADKLENLLQKQASWRVQFTSGIAETQETESRSSKDYLIGEMNREVDSGFPERSYWLWHTHKMILENNGSSPDLEAVRSKNTASGKKKCTDLQSLPTGKDVFLRTFVSRYCSLWGSAWSSKNKIDDAWLYSNVKFENQYKVENLNYSGSLNSQALKDALEKAFRSTAYFHPSANRTLALSMSGTLAYSDHRNSERRRKSYQDEEVTEQLVTTTDEKGVKKDEKQKKKKKITREFSYFVTTHQESANFVSNVKGTVGDQSFSSNHQDSTQRSSESHNESNEKAGVYPQKPKLIDVKSWFAQQDNTAVANFKKDLNQTWSQHFCPLISEASQEKEEKSSQWELVERCGRVETQNQVVDTFYRTRFHLSYSEFWSLLKDDKGDAKTALN